VPWWSVRRRAGRGAKALPELAHIAALQDRFMLAGLPENGPSTTPHAGLAHI
jgi:hypothetical protein